MMDLSLYRQRRRKIFSFSNLYIILLSVCRMSEWEITQNDTYTNEREAEDHSPFESLLQAENMIDA